MPAGADHSHADACECGKEECGMCHPKMDDAAAMPAEGAAEAPAADMGGDEAAM